LLPLWEKVARIDRCATDEGFVSADRDPSPASLRSAPSPTRGEGGSASFFLPIPIAATIASGAAFIRSSEYEAAEKILCVGLRRRRSDSGGDQALGSGNRPALWRLRFRRHAAAQT